MPRAVSSGRSTERRPVWPYVIALVVASIAVHQIGYERAARPATAATVATTAPADDVRTLRALCAAAGVPYPPPDVRLEIAKASRTLTLYAGERALAHYRVGLGFSPVGGKQHEGDGRTPEGELTVVTRNEKSRFRRFLGLSYPRPSDARAAALTPEEADAIERAFADGKKPPWDTPLGGAVGIHGHGSHRDWTSGCVAVDDAVIDVLWEACPLGTRVRIVP